MYNDITIYGTFMCPEYGIYHTRFPQDKKGFTSDEKAQSIPLTDIKVSQNNLFFELILNVDKE
jgi:hypothetical protein